MYSPLDPLFWVHFCYFFLAITLAFFIPGNFLIRRLSLPTLPEIVLSVVVGYVLWSLQGFVFGYLNVRFLSYLYLCLCVLAWLVFYSKRFFADFTIKKPDLALSSLLVAGTVVMLTSVFPNGLLLQNGLSFCCGVPDTMFHLALTRTLIAQVPPHEPAVSGVLLQNYHYLSNLAIADLVRVFRLPLINTQYQYMAVVFCLLLGVTALVLSDLLKFSRGAKLWLLFSSTFSVKLFISCRF